MGRYGGVIILEGHTLLCAPNMIDSDKGTVRGRNRQYNWGGCSLIFTFKRNMTTTTKYQAGTVPPRRGRCYDGIERLTRMIDIWILELGEYGECGLHLSNGKDTMGGY